MLRHRLVGGAKSSKKANNTADAQKEDKDDKEVNVKKIAAEKTQEPAPDDTKWSPLSLPDWMSVLPLSEKLRSLDNGFSRIGIANSVDNVNNNSDDTAVHWANGARMNGRRIFLGSLHHTTDKSWMWCWSWAMDSVQDELISGVDKLPKRVGELTKNLQRPTSQRIELLMQQPFVMMQVNSAISAAALGAMLLDAEYLYVNFPKDSQGRGDVYAILERWD